jgi:hypothetical protein
MQDFKVARLFGIPMKARKISPSRMSLGYFLQLVALKLTVMAHHLAILFVVPMVLSFVTLILNVPRKFSMNAIFSIGYIKNLQHKNFE